MTDLDPQYLQAAVEQHLAELDDTDFNALVARTRPPALTDVKDILTAALDPDGRGDETKQFLTDLFNNTKD